MPYTGGFLYNVLVLEGRGFVVDCVNGLAWAVDPTFIVCLIAYETTYSLVQSETEQKKSRYSPEIRVLQGTMDGSNVRCKQWQDRWRWLPQHLIYHPNL